eukprot:GHVQ01024357.1.p1 GENE.GHVQ01024357.1~~GHVQ01024357.1.p1  ORF type:complete len:258 (-),score=34.39 GHVQ01024357.1:1723-2496(-)
MAPPPFEVRGRHVCVTGGTQGIGWAIAQECVSEGASRVTIMARHGPAGGIENFRWKFVSVDVGVHGSVQNGFHIASEGGERPVDVLICCAGFAHAAAVEDESYSTVVDMVNTNLLGTWNCVNQVLPAMKKQNFGVIVLLGSEASLIGVYGYSGYSCTKFAVKALSDVLWMETQGENILCCLLLPPAVVDTPGFQKEQRDKPHLTQLIEGTTNCLTAKEVAKKTVNRFQQGYRRITFGFLGWCLALATAGTSPGKMNG